VKTTKIMLDECEKIKNVRKVKIKIEK
jgi:hypothetical protein